MTKNALISDVAWYDYILKNHSSMARSTSQPHVTSGPTPPLPTAPPPNQNGTKSPGARKYSVSSTKAFVIKNAAPARNRLALSNGMRFGRPSRKQHRMTWRLPSTHVTVSPCKISPWGCSMIARTGKSHLWDLR